MASSPNLSVTWGVQPLFWHPLHETPPPRLSPPSPPAFCPLPGNSAASVSKLAVSQRCPETVSSRQPPPRAATPTPPSGRDPGLGTMCQVWKEGDLATLREPQGAWERPRAGVRGRGGRSPARPSSSARGDRCGGSWVIFRSQSEEKWHGTRAINTVTADPRSGKGLGWGDPEAWDVVGFCKDTGQDDVVH